MKIKLGDICSFQSGGTPSKTNADYFSGDIPWITTVALNGQTIGKNAAVDWITEKAIEESAAKIVPAKSIMVGTRVGVGKVAINEIPMSTSQDIISLVGINESLWNKGFLCKFIQSKETYLKSQARGATIKGIKIDVLASLDLPDIPYELQQKRVSELNKVQHILTARHFQLSALDDLIKARFVEMFGDFKTNSMKWPIVGFEEIAVIDGNMTTDYEKYADYPHIGIDSIEKETGVLKGYRTVAEDGVISGKYVFTSAHIIYSKIRPNLNKVALPDFNGLCSADAYPILPIEGKCNRVFLAYDMRSGYFLDYILQFCNRTNLPKVNRKEVAGFRTPLPPIELQDCFASFVAQIDKSKAVVQKALDETQLLFDSLMQEYFG